jgi:hypothetical protein
MRREIVIFLIALVLLGLMGMIAGCAPGKQAGRPDPSPEIAVRVPMTESPNVSLRSEEPRKSPEDLPSLIDDTRRPWLTLIEVTVTPAEPESAKGSMESP